MSIPVVIQRYSWTSSRMNSCSVERCTLKRSCIWMWKMYSMLYPKYTNAVVADMQLSPWSQDMEFLDSVTHGGFAPSSSDAEMGQTERMNGYWPRNRLLSWRSVVKWFETLSPVRPSSSPMVANSLRNNVRTESPTVLASLSMFTSPDPIQSLTELVFIEPDWKWGVNWRPEFQLNIQRRTLMWSFPFQTVDE